MDRDLYDVLGVAPMASEAEIRHAFWALAKQYHPDVHGDDPDAARKFIEVSNAAEMLLDPDRRASYDAARRRTQPPVTAAGPAASYAAYAASWAASHPAPPQAAPPPTPPQAPPASRAANTRLLVVGRMIAALTGIGIVAAIALTHPTKNNSNPDLTPTNGTVIWKVADFSLDDGYGINLAGNGVRVQVFPGSTADLMNADGYLSSKGRIAALPSGDAASYQDCVSAVGQSTSQAETLIDIAPLETLCVSGGDGDLASIQVTRNTGSGLIINVTVWEYV